MILVSGKKLNYDNWTPLTMPQDVIDHVHPLSRRNSNSLTICYRDHTTPTNDQTYDDSDDDSYTPSEDDSNDDDNDAFHDEDNNDNSNYDKNNQMPNQPVACDIEGV